MNYWKRYIKFTIGDKEVKEPMVMRFESTFDINSPISSTAYLVNPSEETVAAAEPRGDKRKTLTIEAGFEKDKGVCVKGEICSFRVYYHVMDRVLEMKVGDSTVNWSNKIVNRTWQKDTKASSIVNDLVSMIDLDRGKVSVKSDKTYSRGVSFYMKVKDALKYMARETESDFFIRNGRLYFIPKKDQGIKTGVVISPSKGLLKKPEKIRIGNRDGWRIISLFNYKVGPGEAVSIESKTFSGDVKVISGYHNFTEEEAHTVVEVIPV